MIWRSSTSQENNTNADALSRNPIADTAVTCAIATKQTSAEELYGLNQSVMKLYQQQMQEVRLLQLKDGSLRTMIAYLDKDELLEEERAAKNLIVESKSYEMIKGNSSS